MLRAFKPTKPNPSNLGFIMHIYFTQILPIAANRVLTNLDINDFLSV